MSTIQKVAVAGASGVLGSVLFKKLVDSGKFQVRALKRIGSGSTFPAGTDVVEVDYTSVDSLKAALEGQDAVVSTLATTEAGSQIPLIDAALAAGVKRFLPSEFGSDLDNSKTRQLPVFAAKVKIQEYIINKAKGTDFTYTFVYNAGFLDWGLKQKFLIDFSTDKPTVLDGGDIPFSATTLSSVSDAVIGVLTHLEETKNRAVYIRDIVTTQNKLLAIARTLAPNKTWEPVSINLNDTVANSNEQLAKGNFAFEIFVPYLWKAIFDPEYTGSFGSDNELLGVKGLTEKDLVELVKPCLN